MCLLTKQTDWLIAKRNITCYKMLDYDKQLGKYVTPYEEVIIDDDIICGDRLFVAEKDNSSSYFTFIPVTGINANYCMVESGAIHCYNNWLFASAHAFGYYNLFKCVIPKGTKYAIGNEGDICAEKIKFVKKIYSHD